MARRDVVIVVPRWRGSVKKKSALFHLRIVFRCFQNYTWKIYIYSVISVAQRVDCATLPKNDGLFYMSCKRKSHLFLSLDEIRVSSPNNFCQQVNNLAYTSRFLRMKTRSTFCELCVHANRRLYFCRYTNSIFHLPNSSLANK